MLLADSIGVYYDSADTGSTATINADDPNNEEYIRKILQE